MASDKPDPQVDDARLRTWGAGRPGGERTARGHAPEHLALERAAAGRAFLCIVCGQAYADRAATTPIEVAFERHVTRSQHGRQVHPVTGGAVPEEYGADLERELWTAAEGVVPARDPNPCCAGHTRLARVRDLRVARAVVVDETNWPQTSIQPGPARYEIVGAIFLE